MSDQSHTGPSHEHEEEAWKWHAAPTDSAAAKDPPRVVAWRPKKHPWVEACPSLAGRDGAIEALQQNPTYRRQFFRCIEVFRSIEKMPRGIRGAVLEPYWNERLGYWKRRLQKLDTSGGNQIMNALRGEVRRIRRDTDDGDAAPDRSRMAMYVRAKALGLPSAKWLKPATPGDSVD